MPRQTDNPSPVSAPQPETPWYVNFFKQDYLRIYGHTLLPERTLAETQFAIQALDIQPNQSIMDLCCGQGRHTIALASAGLQVTGIDLSQEMLTIARQNAQNASLDPAFLQADMRSLPHDLHDRFHAVINMFSSFGYLESEQDDQQVLHQISSVLKPNGRLFMDLLNREWVIINNEPYEWRINEDSSITLEHRQLHLHTSTNHITYTRINPDGTREQPSELHMRLYTLTEMIKMLRKAGLRFDKAYGGFQAQPYSVNTRRLIITATKTQPTP